VKNTIKLLEDDETLKRINMTDPDAPIMKGKKGEFDTFYNVQIACNEDRIITHCDVVVSGNDKSQLIPVLEGAANNTNTKIKIALADADYGTFDSFEYMAKNDICGYVPFRNMNSCFDDKPFHISHFSYDVKHDFYVCPANEKLINVGTSIERSRDKKFWVYRTDACKQCTHKSNCYYKSASRRTIKREVRQHLRDEMKERLNDDDGKKIYNRRMHPVESIFGHFKHNLKFIQFLLRGIEKVNAEFTIMCLSHNLIKLAQRMKNNQYCSKIGEELDQFRHQVFKQWFASIKQKINRIILRIYLHICKLHFVCLNLLSGQPVWL